MNIVNVGYDSTNYYVVEQNRIRLLIDVGWPGTLAKLNAMLKRNDINLRDLSYLCITHYHPDHAGLVEELKALGIKHLVLDVQLEGVPLLKNYMKPDSGYVEINLDDSIQLKEIDSRAWLANFGWSGELLHTPGHSQDSISIVLDEGIAFTGDLLSPEFTSGDATDITKLSWAKLRRLNVRTIYPGHGPQKPLL